MAGLPPPDGVDILEWLQDAPDLPVPDEHRCQTILADGTRCAGQTPYPMTACVLHLPVTTDVVYGNPGLPDAKAYRVCWEDGARVVDMKCSPEYLRGFTFHEDPAGDGSMEVGVGFSVIDLVDVDEDIKNGVDTPGYFESIGDIHETVAEVLGEGEDTKNDAGYDGWSWINMYEGMDIAYATTSREFMRGMLDGYAFMDMHLCHNAYNGIRKMTYRGRAINFAKPDMYAAATEGKGDAKSAPPAGVTVVPKEDYDIIMRFCEMYRNCPKRYLVTLTDTEISDETQESSDEFSRQWKESEETGRSLGSIMQADDAAKNAVHDAVTGLTQPAGAGAGIAKKEGTEDDDE